MVVNVQTKPVYIPWLFDDRDAWEKAVTDPRYQYDLPIDAFMTIYREYRDGTLTVSEEQAEQIAAAAFTSSTPSANQPAQSSAESSSGNSSSNEILSQDDIDSLLSGM